MALTRTFVTCAVIAATGTVLADFILAFLVEVNNRIAPNFPWSSMALLILPLVLAALLTSEPTVDRLSLNQFPVWQVLVSTVLGICCLVAVQGAALSIGLHSVAAVGGAKPAGAYIAIPAYSAVVEELLFRGVVQTRVRRVIGNWWSVVFASSLFILIHMARSDFKLQWPLFLAIGLVCGWIASRGSLLTAIFIHAIYNVGANASLHLTGDFHFGMKDDARTLLCVLGALVAGAGVVIVGRLGTGPPNGRVRSQ